MHKRTLGVILYKLSGIIEVLLALGTAGAGGVYKLDSQDVARLGSWAIGMQGWVRSINWILLIAVPLAIPALHLVRERIGAPWVWEHIHSMLDDFQACIFKQRRTQQLHHHRVTLFKHKKFHFCLDRHWKDACLVPIARSGHTSQSSKTKFYVCDSMENRGGIVGMTWAQRNVVEVHDLPDISSNPSEGEIADYALRGDVSEDWVRDRLNKPNPRSLCGIPVEVRGKLWGVLVLDSRDPQLIGTQKMFGLFSLIATGLGKLLERA